MCFHAVRAAPEGQGGPGGQEAGAWAGAWAGAGRVRAGRRARRARMRLIGGLRVRTVFVAPCRLLQCRLLELLLLFRM